MILSGGRGSWIGLGAPLLPLFLTQVVRTLLYLFGVKSHALCATRMECASCTSVSHQPIGSSLLVIRDRLHRLYSTYDGVHATIVACFVVVDRHLIIPHLSAFVDAFE